MTRHFTARFGALKLARTILGQSGKRVLGAVVAFVLALMPVAAFASASCTAVNAQWNGVTIVAHAAEKFEQYSDFDDGDVLIYSVTTQNGVPAELDGTANTAHFSISSDNHGVLAEVYPSGGTELNISNQSTSPLAASDTYYIDAAGSSGTSGDVTATVSCVPAASAADCNFTIDNGASIAVEDANCPFTPNAWGFIDPPGAGNPSVQPSHGTVLIDVNQNRPPTRIMATRPPATISPSSMPTTPRSRCI